MSYTTPQVLGGDGALAGFASYQIASTTPPGGGPQTVQDPDPNDNPAQQWIYKNMPGILRGGAYELDPTNKYTFNPKKGVADVTGTDASFTGLETYFNGIGPRVLIGLLGIVFVAIGLNAAVQSN